MLEKKELDINDDREFLKNREEKLEVRESLIDDRAKQSDKKAKDADKIRELYLNKEDTLNIKEKEINEKIIEVEKNYKESETNKKESEKIFKDAQKKLESIKVKEDNLEKKSSEIEKSLLSKIKEYDEKVANIEAQKEMFGDIELESSEEGKSVKIVVKEAINRAKNLVDNISNELADIQEKYTNPTFLGFSIPLDKIKEFSNNLEGQRDQVINHARENEIEGLCNDLLERLDEYFIQAGNQIKKWEFETAYYNLVKGLTICEVYEILLNILQNYGSDEQKDRYYDDKDPDYYDYLEISENATKEQIKKACREKTKKIHPDAKDDSDDEEMKFLNKVKDTLLNSEKKEQYDNERKQKGKKYE